MKKAIFVLTTLSVAVGAVAQVASKTAAVTPVALPKAQAQLGQTAVMDWDKGVLLLTGLGTASGKMSMAEGEVRSLAAARADAQRLLVVALQSVRVTSTTTVKDFELQSDDIKLEVEGTLRNALPVPGSERIERKNDGSYLARITYVVPVYGEAGVADAIQSELVDQNANKPEPTPPNVTPTRPSTPLGATIAPADGVMPNYTGLVVDARGMNYAPCMSPKVLMSQNREVWGTLYASSDFVNNEGIAAFVRTPQEALKLTVRGAPRQLLIKAVRTVDVARCDVMISDADAQLVFNANAKNGFLAEYKVVYLF